MSSLPRKNSEFLAMYRKDIEEIIKPYGFVYEDREEYYESQSWSAEETKAESALFYKTMPYGKNYIRISSTGRLSEFNIYADLNPAFQEVANIEKFVYGEKVIKAGENILQWQDGSYGIDFDLFSGTHVMRNTEIYQNILKDIKNNLANYLNLTTVRKLFEIYLKRPNFYDDDFYFPNRRRLGYWLIMAKLAGEDYYTELADKYVEINKDKIRKEYNVDITKLKEFLDTYTVGSLA